MEVCLYEAKDIQITVRDEILYLMQFFGGLALTVHQPSGTVPDANSTANFTSNVTIIDLHRLCWIARRSPKSQTKVVGSRYK